MANLVTDLILSSVFGHPSDKARLVTYFSKEKMATFDNNDKQILGNKARQKAADERSRSSKSPAAKETRIAIRLAVPKGEMNYNSKPQRAVKGLLFTTSDIVDDNMPDFLGCQLFVVYGPSSELIQVFNFWKDVKVVDKTGKKSKPNPPVMAQCILNGRCEDMTWEEDDL